MKLQVRKFLALVLCLTMLLNLGMISFAQDELPMVNMDKVKFIYNNNDSAKVIVESTEGLVTAIINKKTNKIDITTFEYNTNKRKAYDAEITSLTDDALDAILIEKNMSISNTRDASYSMSRMVDLDRTIETKSPKKFKLSSKNNGVKVSIVDDERRFVWLLVLAPEVIAALYALAATSLVFVAVGVTWYTGAAIKDLVRQNRNKFYYFGAVINTTAKTIAAGGPLTFSGAKAAIADGNNVFSSDKYHALKLTNEFMGPIARTNPNGEIDSNGMHGDYYYHFHPIANPKLHIFFLGR